MRPTQLVSAVDCVAVDERIESWALSPTSFKESGFLGPTGKVIRRLVEENYAAIFAKSAVEAT